MTGQDVSHYRVLEELGSGGMGVVYRAQDLRLKRYVALKFLSSARSAEPAAIERFRREAEAASALNHPHICTVYDVGEHDGQPFLVLELLEGRSLAAIVAAGPLPPERIVAHALQIADALDAAHAKGIVHRDLKPSNVWVTTRGDAKILDFGVAKLADSLAIGRAPSTELVVTAPGASIGTPQYMSPEQVRGDPADARSDLFSLGLVIYEMATGRPAFSGATVGVVLDSVLNRSPELPSAIVRTVPAALEQIILRAVEKDPALRYQSARDLMADLRRVMRDGAGPPTPGAGRLDSTSPRLDVRPSHSRARMAALAAAVVLVLAAATWWYERGRSSPETASPTAAPAAGPARLVVLPFENLTQQPADAWLAGAFSDALSAGLQPLDDIVLVPRERVVELYAAESRQESQSLSSELARQISERLRVRYYVHGSYQRVGDDLRVVARLVDAERDAIEAQETLTNRVANVFALEDELASRFASRLGGRAARAATQGETPPLDAYQAVVDARAHYALGRLSEARALLQRAVDRAPRYALAWAWLSKTDSRLASPANFEGNRVRTELLQRALKEANTAIALQPRLVDGELAMALAVRGTDPAALRAATERAIELDPRNGEARGLMAEANAISASFGCPRDPRPELAEQQYRDAIAIDPLHGNVRLSLTTHLWWMNRQPEAFAVLDEGLSILPDNVLLKTWRPFNMAFAGRAEEAFALWRSDVSGLPDLKPIDAFIGGVIELKRRRFESADEYFRRAGTQLADTLPFPMIAAVANLQAGRMVEGADLLRRGLQAHADCTAWFDRVPAFAPFKNEPAVRAVLAHAERR
jgi:serine/threonine protein kinase